MDKSYNDMLLTTKLRKDGIMLPTSILSDEHRVIEVVLTCLERMSDQALVQGRLDQAAADQAVDFLRSFADRCHHGKEENQLFTLMEQKGVPREGGPIGVMLHEHEQGREYIRGMAASSAAAGRGDAQALQVFAANTRGYVNLLRAHIHKEDHILFPMAARVFDAEDENRLISAFETVEKEHMGVGTHEKYLALARSLAEKFGVPADNLSKHACGCSHK